MKYINILLIIVSSILIISILLQQRGTALGSAFGGSGEFYLTRRGIQKKLLYTTLIALATFIGISVFRLFL